MSIQIGFHAGRKSVSNIHLWTMAILSIAVGIRTQNRIWEFKTKNVSHGTDSNTILTFANLQKVMTTFVGKPSTTWREGDGHFHSANWHCLSYSFNRKVGMMARASAIGRGNKMWRVRGRELSEGTVMLGPIINLSTRGDDLLTTHFNKPVTASAFVSFEDMTRSTSACVCSKCDNWCVNGAFVEIILSRTDHEHLLVGPVDMCSFVISAWKLGNGNVLFHYFDISYQFHSITRLFWSNQYWIEHPHRVPVFIFTSLQWNVCLKGLPYIQHVVTDV